MDRNVTQLMSDGYPLVWDLIRNQIIDPSQPNPNQVNRMYNPPNNNNNNGGNNGGNNAGGNAGGNVGGNAGINPPANQGTNSGQSSGSVNNYGPGGTMAFCGQVCYGNVNSCDPISGCSCVSKRVSSQRHNAFFSTCGVAYTSPYTHRRRLSETDINSTIGSQAALGPDTNFVSAAPFITLSDTACPCNCTYVSHACCDGNLNGIVQEASSLKLGEVELPPGVICNRTTGLPQNGTESSNTAGQSQNSTEVSTGQTNTTVISTGPSSSTGNGTSTHKCDPGTCYTWCVCQ
ncbi:MAG: hypothetical protein Q9218_001830 [Villophora microphyllina]